MTSTKIQALIAAVNDQLRINREAAYRRALEATGHTPGSVEIMLAKDREWIESGDEA